MLVTYSSSPDQAQEAVNEIRACGVRALAHQADVASAVAIQDMFKRMRAELGTVDILVANAGLQQDASIDAMTLAQWNEVLSVNLTGQFLCAQEAVREFRRRGVVRQVSCAAGKIICMSSVHQVIPWAGHINYAASKGGVHLLMRSLAQEVAPDRIRVNAIAPGAIRTRINRSAWQTKEAYDRLMALIPYRPHWRTGGCRTCSRVAGQRCLRLCCRHHALRRWWHDPLSRFRRQRLNPAPAPDVPRSAGAAAAIATVSARRCHRPRAVDHGVRTAAGAAR